MHGGDNVSKELLDICKSIKATVENQPSRSEMKNIAYEQARLAIAEHETGCPVREDYPVLRQEIGRLQGGKKSSEPPKPAETNNKKWIALGTIIGAALPVFYALWRVLF
jgi:LPS O-antigen subunit length determinant protein (WzzB/FepE family)